MSQYKPGDLIDGVYSVLDVFGGTSQSGMGVVYLVHDREAPRPFVLKTFQGIEDDEMQQRFISEAHAWVKAGAQTNIVQAYWVRRIDGQLYIAAEYIRPDEDGRNTLAHFLNIRPLRPEIILLWSTQFCRGMEYALSKGVHAHRDIKPDNLMIDRNMTLKITDFGLAKSTESMAISGKRKWFRSAKKPSADKAEVTKTGSAMGTLPYMAPELFIDAKNADHRTDIYSFGIILYQMVTGNRYPYSMEEDASDIDHEYFEAHTKRPPEPVDSPFMPLIEKCLEKAPNRRYKSYDALHADLIRIANNYNIYIPPDVSSTRESEELYAMAQSYVALGDSDRALDAINEYVSRYPDHYWAWTEKGKIHIERGEYKTGITATKQSLSLNPYNTHAWNNLGILLNRTHAPLSDIKKAYHRAIRLDSYNTVAMMNLVGPLMLNSKHREAATLAARSLRYRPEKPLVLAKAQEILKELMLSRDFESAEKLLAGWTMARPSDKDAWHNRGLIALEKQELDRAIRCFRQVHRLDHEDNFAIEQLARLYFLKKRARECLNFCEILIQRKHEVLLAVSLKARTMNYIGGYNQALEFLQPYINNNSDNDALWVVLSEIHEYVENYGAAINTLGIAKNILLSNANTENVDDLDYINQKLKELIKLMSSSA